jgi:hypothetical protein
MRGVVKLRASAARSSPEGNRARTGGKDVRLASGTVSPATPCIAAAATPTATCDKALGYALNQRLACFLRPIFCAFAPCPTYDGNVADLPICEDWRRHAAPR